MKYFCGKLLSWRACIYCVISVLTSTSSGLSSNNFHTLPSRLNGLQKEKYTPNT